MKMTRIMMLALTTLSLFILLAGCEEAADSETYNNPYAGDWYEVEENDEQWDAVKLSFTDTTFEISESTFDADGDNPDGYSGVSKGEVDELSGNQIFIKTTKRRINDEWFDRDQYIDDLVDHYAFNETQAELQADLIFSSATLNYSIGANPTRLILGSGTGIGTDYFNMTCYTSVFTAKNLAD